MSLLQALIVGFRDVTCCRDRGAYYPILDHNNNWYAAVTLFSDGLAVFPLSQIKSRHPFDDEPKRLEYLRRLNEIDGVSIPATAIAGRPRIKLADLERDGRMNALLSALDWFYDEVRSST